MYSNFSKLLYITFTISNVFSSQAIHQIKYYKALLDVDEDKDYKTRCTKYLKRGRGCIEEMLEGINLGADLTMDFTDNQTFPSCDFTEWK